MEVHDLIMGKHQLGQFLVLYWLEEKVKCRKVEKCYQPANTTSKFFEQPVVLN